MVIYYNRLGSGGRIALNGQVAYSLNIYASGGANFGCTTNFFGGAGTVYFASNDTLMLQNGASLGSEKTPIPSYYISSIVVTASVCTHNLYS